MSNVSLKSLWAGDSPKLRSITLPTGINPLIGGVIWAEPNSFIGKRDSVRERRPGFVVSGVITLQGD